MRALLFHLMLILTGATLCAAEPATKEPVAEPKAAPVAKPAELKDFNDYFPWTPPATKTAWEPRRVELLRQLQLAVGLYPMPDRSAAPQAVIHGLVDRPEYTVERVYFESLSGFYVTGSLYRPKNARGKLPAILNPHGHWNQGRFHAENDAGLKRELASGAEQFEIGGRHPLQARCVQLARLGYVAFMYDMLGYADSVQIPYEVAHRFMKRRPTMERDDQYGFFSPQAEARLQSVMGLQTWNSLRAFDWLASLPEVDAERIGITGASGGGTQSFIAAALEPRIAAAFPAVMVSTAMQGGCTCENCNYLRVDTGNIELAALIAPRPLGMTTANDWTKELATKGFPELQALYKLYGAETKVSMHDGTKFPHNYNSPARHAMYEFFQKYLQPDSKADIAEKDYIPLTRDELTVWTADHPAPKSGADVEVALLKEMQKQGDAAVKGAKPEEIAAAFETMAGKLPEEKEVVFQMYKATHYGHSGFSSRSYRLNRKEAHNVEKLLEDSVDELLESFPGFTGILVTTSPPKNDRTRTIIQLDSSQTNRTEPPYKNVRLDKEHPENQLFRIDVRGLVPNSNSPQNIATKNSRVKNDRDYAGFTYGYNHSFFAQRVANALTTIVALSKEVGKEHCLVISAEPGSEHWALAAALVAGDKLTAIELRSTDFRFSKLTAYDDADFWPGAVKYGDLPGLLRCQTVPVLIARSEAAEKLVNEIKHPGLRVEFYDPAKPEEFLQALDRVQKK